MSETKFAKPRFNITNINHSLKKRSVRSSASEEPVKRSSKDLWRDLDRHLFWAEEDESEFWRWYIEEFCFSRGGEVRDFYVEKKLRERRWSGG